MEDNCLYIQFIIKCDQTKPGEEIYILGNENELGNWNRSENNKLKTNKVMFPFWESDFIKFKKNYSDLNYKYVIIIMELIQDII